MPEPQSTVAQPTPFQMKITDEVEVDDGKKETTTSVFGFPAGVKAVTPKIGDSSVPFERVFQTLDHHEEQTGRRPIVKLRSAGFEDLVEQGDGKDQYIRPNGEEYFPRKIQAGASEVTDVALVQRAFERRMPVLCYGPPGTGKTALFEAVMPNIVELPGNGDTEVPDMMGTFVQNPDLSFTWVNGPLLVVMREGRPLMIDEIALVDPRVMALVYPIMDKRDVLHVTLNPQYMCNCGCETRGIQHPQDGFYVVGACNPDVPGAVMSDALKSRFPIKINVLTDFDLAIQMGVPREIVIVARNLKRKHEQEQSVLACPQMRELLDFRDIAREFGMDVAIANFISGAETADQPKYAELITGTFGRESKALTIG